MKKLSTFLAASTLVMGFSSAFAQSSASADASANIVTPLQIIKTSDLLFGNIASGPTPGLVDMALNDVRTAMGGVTLISAGNISNAAAFDILGHPDASFTISLPTSISIVSGSNDMTVDNFSSSLGSTSILDAQGQAIMKVGATLNVDANQPVGLYTGSFDVTVAYN
jgi:hypothetical protein